MAWLFRRFRPVGCGGGDHVRFALVTSHSQGAFVGFDLREQVPRAGRLLGGEAATCPGTEFRVVAAMAPSTAPWIRGLMFVGILMAIPFRPRAAFTSAHAGSRSR